MKPFKAVLLASLVLGACEKSDNVNQLHSDAVAIAKYYGPRVDDLAKRRDAIYQRGRNVPGNLPDVPEVVRLINESSDKIKEMQGITGGIQKEADEQQKANKPAELARLSDESREKLDADWTIANEDLARIEGWLWQFEQGKNTAPPQPTTPLPTPNDTGEPPPAAAAGSGDEKKGDEKKDEKKASDKRASEKKPAEKAAEKSAGEKADKGAPKADKAAAPKAAGSAAGSAAK